MPNFTKKHYEIFAYLIGVSKTKKDLERNIIDAFKSDNERFDEKRFKDAVNKHKNIENLS